MLIDNEIIEPTGIKYSKGLGKISLKEMKKYWEEESLYTVCSHKISRYWKDKIKKAYPRYYKRVWERRFKEIVINQLEKGEIKSNEEVKKLYEKMLETMEKKKTNKKGE